MELTSEQIEIIRKHLSSKEWRMNNLYYIKDKYGKEVVFKLNAVQEKYAKNKHNRNIILKARQQGFTTYECINALDSCLFNSNYDAGIIAHTVDDAEKIFTNKVKFAFDRLPEIIRTTLKPNNDRAGELRFPNGSSISVSAGFRGGTLMKLHVSEYGKICAKYPEKAREIRTGAFNAVPKDGDLTVESTAEGMSGDYYDLWGKAELLDHFTPMDFKAHFFPWYESSEYRLNPEGIKIPDETSDYFAMLETDHGIKLDAHQKAWYFKKSQEQDEDIHQEYPSYPEEAFMASGRPVFNREKIARDIKRAKDVPYKRGIATTKGFEENARGNLSIFHEPVKGHAYSIGCLPDNEIVLTANGWKKIQLVDFSDQLIDKDGKLVEIKNIQRRNYMGQLINLKPYYTSVETKFTPEHPILALKDNKIKRHSSGDKHRYYNLETEFKKAGELTLKDILRVPIQYKKELSAFEILPKLFQKGIRVDRKINPTCIMDKDFWYFMGLWLAEGWIYKGSNGGSDVTVCFNSKTEQASIARISGIIKKLFNRTASVTARKTNSTELVFRSEAIHNFIAINFGQKAGGKDIAEWIKFLPRDLKLSLFEGYVAGDGCYVQGKNRSRIACVSISEKLLHDFQGILLSCGIISSVKVLREKGVAVFKGKEYPTKKTFELLLHARDSDLFYSLIGKEAKQSFSRRRNMSSGWIDGDYFYVKIHRLKREEFDGNVNNFETETHSYCSPMITTHNCDVAEGLADGDFSTATVLNKNFEQVAVYKGHLDPDLFGRMLVNLAKYYNNALLAPELNNHGHATLAAIKNENYYQVYRREVQEELGKEVQDKVGWLNNVKSKAKMLDDFKAAYRDGSLKLNHEETLREMLTLTLEEDGNVILNSKDLCVSVGLAIQGLTQAVVPESMGAFESGGNKQRFETLESMLKWKQNNKSEESYFD